MEKVCCSGLEIDYIIVRKPIKNLYLRVKEGYVQINCGNSFSKRYILDFICKNIDFIRTKLAKNDISFLFGKEYKDVNRDLLKQKLPPVIEEFIDKYSKMMQLYPSRVGFRFNKSRWGSCSYKNSINFNYYLAKLPLDVIEYVVVHELAHIKYKNHSKEFWSLVEHYLPDMRERRKKLREYEKII